MHTTYIMNFKLMILFHYQMLLYTSSKYYCIHIFMFGLFRCLTYILILFF